jgi:hypothetical protein
MAKPWGLASSCTAGCHGPPWSDTFDPQVTAGADDDADGEGAAGPGAGRVEAGVGGEFGQAGDGVACLVTVANQPGKEAARLAYLVIGRGEGADVTRAGRSVAVHRGTGSPERWSGVPCLDAVLALRNRLSEVH